MALIQKVLFVTVVAVVPTVIVTNKILAAIYPHADANLVITNILPQETPPPKLSWLSTRGKDIVDETGRKMILRGVNMGSTEWEDGSWHVKAINRLGNLWTVNVIRVRVLEKDYVKNKDDFFRRLEWEFLRPARKNGLYVLVHPKVIHEENDLGSPELTSLWHDLAVRYRDDPTVLFDLLPEPHDTTWAMIRTHYQQLIGTVREVHPQSLIFVSGHNWGREINEYVDNPLPYANIVYRTNPYNEPFYFERQFGKITGRLPVFFGEFGADGKPYMSREAVQNLLDFARSNQLGWTAWNFHDEGCPCILADKSTFQTTPYGEIIREALQSSSHF